ncbi:MAG TPA: hypothetical protein VHL79_24430, partial [Ramlibacter sp.]|nr:hypothetical protein [Ramlibacter sp.]
MTDRLNMGQLWNAARTGEALARERGIPPGQPTNSFTHAFFSAYITNHYSENAARVLGDWRERVGGNSERDRNVDLWNNGQGREVGRNLPLNTPVGAIADAVKQRMDSGGLVMNKNDPRVDPQSFPRDLLPGGISGSMNNWGLFDPMGNPVSGDVNAAYSAARNWSPPQDPLVLDLNGNGIQTVGLDGASSVLFDHDGDGVRTGTGWIAGDDGILVLDRNGNGAVDSGRELFGDNTPLPDGSVASNGFEALAQHDTNGDGQIDAQDPTFHSLRVWQDLNQNGVSEANELRTLDALGVRSIGVQAISTNIWLGNGNTQVYSGTFTRTDGTSGQSGSAELTGSLLLAANHFYREFTDDPLVTPTARALPQSGGSGSVRDLREAMSLGTNASQELQTVVAQFSSAQERDVQRGLLPTLIHAWASTSSMPPGMERFGAPSGSTGPNRNRADAVAQFASASPGLYEQITTLERFNGDEILEQLLVLHSGSTWDPYLHQWVGYSYYVVQISGAQQAFLDAAWRSLEESVYGSLVIQTRLAEYWAAVDVLIDGDSISFDLTAFEALLNEARAANEREATWDLYDLNKYGHDRLLEVGFDGMETLREWMAGLPAGSTLRSELAAGGLIHGAGVASDAAELYL